MILFYILIILIWVLRQSARSGALGQFMLEIALCLCDRRSARLDLQRVIPMGYLEAQRLALIEVIGNGTTNRLKDFFL